MVIGDLLALLMMLEGFSCVVVFFFFNLKLKYNLLFLKDKVKCFSISKLFPVLGSSG